MVYDVNRSGVNFLTQLVIHILSKSKSYPLLVSIGQIKSSSLIIALPNKKFKVRNLIIVAYAGNDRGIKFQLMIVLK